MRSQHLSKVSRAPHRFLVVGEDAVGGVAVEDGGTLVEARSHEELTRDPRVLEVLASLLVVGPHHTGCVHIKI